MKPPGRLALSRIRSLVPLPLWMPTLVLPTAHATWTANSFLGRLEGDYAGGPLHAYTSELVGKAIIWDYGAGFTQVKHIYNSNLFYTYSMDTADGPWMATNPADYIKVRDHFYIFSFVEERQPGLQMLLLINLDTLHDIGCVFGVNEMRGMSSGCVGGHGTLADTNTLYDLKL